MVRNSSLRRDRCYQLTCGLTLSFLILCADFSLAQESKPVAQASSVPIVEGLPHIALPRGSLKAWCGRKDRYLLSVDGQLEAYDASVKAATLAVSSRWPIQCDPDGKQLIYVNTEMGYATRIDIASGASQLLASYKPTDSGKPVSSPDLQTIASDGPLQPAADGSNLKIINVRGSNASGSPGQIRDIRWSEDSSKLLVAYFREIEVLDARGVKIGAGRLPNETYYRAGWFEAGQRALILLLALDEDESGPGRLVKCRIADWKCERIKPLVTSVSIGGLGILATVAPFGTPPAPGPDDDGGTILQYDKYVAELRDRAASLAARQILPTTNGRRDFELSVSPSGAKAILTWEVSPSANCQPADLGELSCAQGIFIDLSKVIK